MQLNSHQTDFLEDHGSTSFGFSQVVMGKKVAKHMCKELAWAVNSFISHIWNHIDTQKIYCFTPPRPHLHLLDQYKLGGHPACTPSTNVEYCMPHANNFRNSPCQFNAIPHTRYMKPSRKAILHRIMLASIISPYSICFCISYSDGEIPFA